MDIVVGISGATGVLYAVRLLEALKKRGVNTHLIVSDWGKKNLEIETPYHLDDIEKLAAFVYDCNDLGAAVSSGSFKTDGMVILPCSMKTLSAVANGYNDNLIARAADVTLKEGRKLVLCPRETPLSAIHLENMLKLARLGVVIAPPAPAFYNDPKSIEDIIKNHTMKVLDQFGISYDERKRWNGLKDMKGEK